MIASDGEWAFDHSGWTRKAELLDTTRAAFRRTMPGWDCDRLVITDGLDAFCEANRHRKPSRYPDSPWQRAFDYLARFPPQPPVEH
ncbi:MAG: hypothetical protein QOD41_3461 [Cryptosporangiaceae bacterium]|jgi:hypothetical protein|nr:hypothetical protein [Cryptosporangiaceae bacterium]